MLSKADSASFVIIIQRESCTPHLEPEDDIRQLEPSPSPQRPQHDVKEPTNINGKNQLQQQEAKQVDSNAFTPTSTGLKRKICDSNKTNTDETFPSKRVCSLEQSETTSTIITLCM